MSMSPTYRTIATLLWLVVAVLTAATITTLWNLPARQQVFFYVAGVGLVLLVSLNQWRQRQPLVPQKLMSGIIEQLPPPAIPTSQAQAQAGNAKPATGGEIGENKELGDTSQNTNPEAGLPADLSSKALAKEEAREWLDEFLVKQQQS
ncbi:MAG: hypothetical protein WD972_02075 [Candidatus Andersenbacteria bacterium]